MIMRKSKLSVFLLSAAILLSAMNTPAFSASPADESFSSYVLDEDMRILQEPSRPFTFSYGAWVTPVIIDDRSGSNELATSFTTTRLWFRASLWGSSYLYVRGKHQYQYVLVEENMTAEDNDHLVDLDVGFLHLANSSGSVQLSLGRKFFVIGTGLVLNGRGDGGELDIFTSIADIKILGAYTGLLNKDNNPYNLSEADFTDGAKRVFAGGTVTRSFYNQTLYVFGLAQIDLADEEDNDKVRYQSQYYGGGLNGVIFSRLRYYGEFAYETGKSYLSGTDTQSDIKAHAGQAGINLFLDTIFNPVLIAQYAYGTGDADRSDYRSPTGNTENDDTGFLYFGTFTGGYALRPVLANLHVFRAGLALSPFSFSRYRTLRRITLLGKYTYYRKYNSEAYINYGEAPFDNSDVGQGIDAALRWRIFNDLSLFANYAVFFPGKAYASDEDTRHFMMAGITLVL